MATMNVSLPDAMKEWVEAQVETGKYGNTSDYVRDLVRRDQERAEAQQKLQQLVDKAHIVCPYSNATRNNIDVRLHVNP